MVSQVQITDAFTRVLDHLADTTQARLVATFDTLGGYDEDAAWLFRSRVRPLITSAAQASINASSGYLTALGMEVGPASGLVVADSAARCLEPFDRLGRNLNSGMQWMDAVTGARSMASALGDDAVYRTARNGIAQMSKTPVKWQRRLSSKCCDWCMNLSGVEFFSAAQATFGHNRCRCVPVPLAAIGDRNAKIRESEGFDELAQRRFNGRVERRRIQDQERLAARRSREAAAEALTEPDPIRRERLETRAQEWETRSEAAAERLRIFDTGSHLLAA